MSRKLLLYLSPSPGHGHSNIWEWLFKFRVMHEIRTNPCPKRVLAKKWLSAFMIFKRSDQFQNQLTLWRSTMLIRSYPSSPKLQEQIQSYKRTFQSHSARTRSPEFCCMPMMSSRTLFKFISKKAILSSSLSTTRIALFNCKISIKVLICKPCVIYVAFQLCTVILLFSRNIPWTANTSRCLADRCWYYIDGKWRCRNVKRRCCTDDRTRSKSQSLDRRQQTIRASWTCYYTVQNPSSKSLFYRRT